MKAMLGNALIAIKKYQAKVVLLGSEVTKMAISVLLHKFTLNQ